MWCHHHVKHHFDPFQWPTRPSFANFSHHKICVESRTQENDFQSTLPHPKKPPLSFGAQVVKSSYLFLKAKHSGKSEKSTHSCFSYLLDFSNFHCLNPSLAAGILLPKHPLDRCWLLHIKWRSVSVSNITTGCVWKSVHFNNILARFTTALHHNQWFQLLFSWIKYHCYNGFDTTIYVLSGDLARSLVSDLRDLDLFCFRPQFLG